METSPHILIASAPEDEKKALALWARLDDSGVATDIWPIREADFNPRKKMTLDDTVTHLIVLCSPSAVQNFSVTKAIDLYLKKNRIGSVFPVLVSSAPDSNGIESSYPSMLRQKWQEGRLVAEKPIDPIADLRSGSMTMSLVAEKIMLALGVRAQKKPRKIPSLVREAAIAASLVLILGSTSIAVVQSKNAKMARMDAARSQQFSDRLLTDLESNLSSSARREVFSVVGGDVISATRGKRIAELPDEQLSQLSKLLHLIGDARTTDGDVDGAIEAFTLASDITSQLMTRFPDDLERMFDHSQSVFWLGNVEYVHGRFSKAKPFFQSYSDYSEKLIQAAPNNPKYIAELAYAKSNNGIVSLFEGDAGKASNQFSQAIRLYTSGLLDTGVVRGDSLANAYDWSARASVELGDLSEAEAFLNEEEKLWRGLVSVTPNNRTRHLKLANSLLSRAMVLIDRGKLETADRVLKGADQILSLLSSKYPDDHRILRKKLVVMRERTQIALWRGKIGIAQLTSTVAKKIRVGSESAKADYDREFSTGTYELLSARIAYAAGEFKTAHTFSVLAVASFERAVHGGQLYRKHYIAESMFVRGETLYALGQKNEAKRAWVIGLGYFDQSFANQNLRAKDTQAKLLWRLGKLADAKAIRKELIASGYGRKESIPVWKDQEELTSSVLSLKKERTE